ncbi:helix-turn-helix transcriptional regulator [Leptolyngbya sp. AN03gr2]|uniref:helix-turn-helix transcriptional regulator n=1 Tax=unclassified Leptolyngbya TaxID=2650499 RepID=UPI003D323EB4
MNLKITVQDLSEMFEEIHSQTGIPFHSNEYETHLNLPRQLGNGSIQNWHLREGLELYVQTYELGEELTIFSHNQYALFGLCYGISGTANMSATHSSAETRISPGTCLTVGMTEAQTIGRLPANQAIRFIEIAIAPELLRTLLTDELDTLPLNLRQCLQKTDYFYWQQSAIVPAMMTALHQILHCPYQGATQRVYLEGKVLELLALQIHQFAERRPHRTPRRLRSDEVERIYQARDILIQQLHNPPSLLALARQVGLNDYKLKQGFHQVFGTTAFGCLHQHRMEQARFLLEAQNIQVEIAAQTVGYNSLSSFHKAYKKYFGVNPSVHRNRR